MGKPSSTSEQARLTTLFSQVRDAVVLLDREGRIQFWNREAGRLFGYRANEVLNKVYLDLLPVEFQRVQQRMIRRALEGFDSYTEWESQRQDGSRIWLEGDFRPMHGELGEIRGVVVVIHDITKIRAEENARQASEARLREICDNFPGAVFQAMMNPEGVFSFTFFSVGILALVEANQEEINQAFFEQNSCLCPNHQTLLLDAFRESANTLLPCDLELNITTRQTQQNKWLRVRATPKRNEDGSTTWNGVMIDVTDRIRSGEALRESEARYRLMTENVTDLICRLSPSGEIQFVSPACESLLGFTPTELVGLNWHDIVYAEDQENVAKSFRQVVTGQGPQILAYRLRRKDQSLVWVESSSRAILDRYHVREVISVTRDIEDRKKLEAKIGNALKMEAVGRLAGGIAHDFNNLLTVINGFSEMLLKNLEHQDTSRSLSQVKEIRTAGERASGLVRQLLAFGRQQIQTRTRVNLNQVVTDSANLLSRLIGEDITLKTELSPDLGLILADVTQLDQVLMNLVVNARDALPDGGQIILRTSNVEIKREHRFPDDVRPGQYVMLEVEDDGCGMDEKIMSRIFEPFFTTKDVGKGTGLGLAMVYGIVKQSEGHISVESRVNDGTKFRIYLPRLGTVDSKTPLPMKKRPDTVFIGRETILLVEDDSSVRKVVASLIQSLGYRVVEATGGMEALRTCREYTGTIHLLLTDVVMPMMNGRELADRVKKILPGIKVLFMSGYTDDSILRHGVLDEGVSFINKPISHESLARKLQEVLQTPELVS